MNKETVDNGKLVVYKYKVIDDQNGEELFSTPDNAPDMMVYGENPEVVPGLLVALKGLGAGDKFNVTLPPAAGFGDNSEDLIMHLPHSVFTNQDGKMPEEVKEGAVLTMMTAEGQPVNGKVIAITPEEVTMDFNHPFAGKTVRLEGEVVDVHTATPEELQALKQTGCNCGCNHEDCGNHDSDSCGCGGGCQGCH